MAAPSTEIPAFMELVEDLNDAIENENYAKIEKMLADPKVPLNYKILEVVLPIERMFDARTPKIAQMFLKCARVDWLAPSWDRSCLELQSAHGIQYETFKTPKNQATTLGFGQFGLDLRRAFERRTVHTPLDYFYFLPLDFVEACPREAETIYERIFEELFKAADEAGADRNLLLFQVADSVELFKKALKHCPNVNVRNAEGQTILHKTGCLEVAKLVITLGADLNALDNSEKTPLMTHQKPEILKLYIQKGANANFINSRHETVLSCNQYKHEEFIEWFEISEQVFRTELLSKRNLFKPSTLKKLFEKYPSLKSIFEADLPANLICVNQFHSLDYFSKLSDEEYLQLVKNCFTRDFQYGIEEVFKAHTKLIKANADALLHCASKANNAHCMTLLLNSFKANPNSEIDGQRPLFLCTSPLAFEALLKHRADPKLECNGYKFFERDEPLTEATFSWFQLLHQEGFDLFAKAAKSGKSFLESFDPQTKLSASIDPLSFEIPIWKLKRFFSLDSGWDILGPGIGMGLTPIDEDGNCLLHYAIEKERAEWLLCCKFDELKKVENRFGVSSYDLLLEKDKNFRIGRLIEDKETFASYVKDFEAKYGRDYLYRNGASILLHSFNERYQQNRLNFTLAEYILDVVGVSLNRVTPKGLLIDRLYDVSFDDHEQVFDFLKKRGFKRAKPRSEE